MFTSVSLASARRGAMWLLVAVLAVAVTMLVLDGGRPAVAAGECEYQPYGDPCPKVVPTLTTAPQPAQTQVGSYLYDRATLSGGNSPTGTLTFALFRPGDEACSNAVFTWQAGVNGNGDHYSGSVRADTVGTWRWTVAYSGDAQHEAVTSGCADEPVSVTKAAPTVSFWPQGSTTIGSSLSASGYGYGGFQPSGAVTVGLYGPDDESCSGAPVSTQSFWWSGGWVNIWSTYGPVDQIGTWRYRLDYPGDANNDAYSLACGTASTYVGKAYPYLWVGASPGALTIGGEVTVNGQLAYGYQPTGAIVVSVFAPDDPGCSFAAQGRELAIGPNGTFATTFTPTSVGTWRVVASYAGDGFNNPASTWCGALTVAVSKASPTVFPAASPTTAETNDRLQGFTLVQGGYQPGGRVSFRLYRPDDPTCVGLPAYIEEANVVGGIASTSTGFVAPSEGTWRWQAVYLGDDNNNGMTSGCDQAPASVVARLGTPPRDPGGTPFLTSVYFNCVDDHNIGVPYGSRLVLRLGWGAQTERQVRGVLTGSRTRALIDGVTVANADQYWGRPFFDGWLWVSRWEYDTGKVLTSYTQPFTIEFEVVATKVVTDGVTTWSPGDDLVSIGGPCLVAGFQPT